MSTVQTYPRGRFLDLVASEWQRITHRRVIRWILLVGLALYVLVIVIAFFNHSKSGDPHPAFRFGDLAGDGAVGMGVATAIFMYIIGTTYAGAEWSQRTIVALLFWEPRRWRVMQAKILTVAIVSTVLTVITQVIWLVTALALASAKGTTNRPSGFWSDLFIRQGLVLLFTILIAWLGFGIANLVRVSAASLGVGFVYFVIVENVVATYWESARQYLLGVNSGALLTRGGVDFNERHISTLHGGVEWAVVSIGVLAIGSVLFSRRDAS